MMHMDTTSMHVTNKGDKHKSELEKFQIFYEFATSTTAERNRLKSQRVRRGNDA